MADSEQVKAALAALADRESPRDGRTRADGVCGHEQSIQDEPAVDEGPQSAGNDASEANYREIIERAVAATEDLDEAVEFVDTVGLDRLEAAVERAEHEVSGLADDGREALATFERFRVAAEGPVEE